MLDPMKLADIHDLIEHLQEGLHFARSIGAKQVTADVEHVELLIDAASRADDGLNDDIDAALDALIRRINGEADLPSAAEWVRLNYPGRAKDLRPVEVAGDVGERLARAMASVDGNDPDRLVWHRVAGGVSEPWGSAWQAELPAAAAALRALRPGDVVPAGVVAPREPTEAMWGGLARDIVMWTRFPHQSGSALHAHLRNCAAGPAPAWLLAEIPDTDAVPPKGTVAACIYKAMLAAIQEPPHAD